MGKIKGSYQPEQTKIHMLRQVLWQLDMKGLVLKTDKGWMRWNNQPCKKRESESY
jgi:hypothetical protein